MTALSHPQLLLRHSQAGCQFSPVLLMISAKQFCHAQRLSHSFQLSARYDLSRSHEPIITLGLMISLTLFRLHSLSDSVCPPKIPSMLARHVTLWTWNRSTIQLRARPFSTNIPSTLRSSSALSERSIIDPNYDLFNYTSGRWVYNEKRRLSERFCKFNVDELKRVAAQSIQRCHTEVKSLTKLAEGGFNRVLQITMADGTQVLARLPYPSIESKHFAVASEVATLALLRAHEIPVPRVLAFSTDVTNPVGAEYIIMEKLSGRPLGDTWFDLSERERLKVLLQIVQLEAKLYTIELPAYGSLYHSQGLPNPSPRILMSDSDFCVGPDASLKWWFAGRGSLPIDRGPYVDAIDVLRGPALKELDWLRTHGRPRFPFERAYRESMNYKLSPPEDHMRSLNEYLKVIPQLLPSKDLLRPVLRHPDLQPNNIFVSDDYDVIGLIDWQHASVLPLFLAAGIPKFFQNYDDLESLVFKPPLRPDLTDMDDEEKASALEEYRRRHVHFFYLGFTQRFNEPHFRAIDQATSLLTRRIFTHAGEPWEGNNVPLQADLVLITRAWNEYSAEPCPISFSSTEADTIMRFQGMQEEVDGDLKLVRGAIGVGTDGWTGLEEYDAAVARARQMKADGLASLDTEYEKEMTSRHWPFDDHDEDE